MNEEELKILTPFGPSIAVVRIPEKIIKDLNNYVDKIVNDEKKINQLDHGKNLAGNVKQEFRLEADFMKDTGWGNFLANGVKYWVGNAINKKITKCNILSSWIVRQFKNEYNPTHYHAGHISGAGFLKLPKTFGAHIQKKDIYYQGGNLQLIHGNRLFLCPSMLNIKPKVGDFYFFPHYLMHTVFP